MNFCPSAVAAAAVFTALIINDLINKDYTPITFHLLGGIFVVLGIMTLCQYIGDYAGWLLLLIPIFVILIGFFLEWLNSPSKASVSISEGPTPGPCFIPCPYCGYCNPCRCRRKKNCNQTTQTTQTNTVIGSDLPPNPQVSTLGKKNC